MNRLATFRIDRGLERWANWTEWPLILLSLVFLVVLILPLASPLTAAESRALDIANVAIWGIFVADYLVRVYLAPARWAFVRGHILDLIVVAVPFLRPFRLLRLIAIVLAASRRAGGQVVQQVTIYVAGVAAIVTSVAAVVIYDAERKAPDGNIHTLGEAFWWAITTMTTVGYGDYYPTTTTGKLVASALMLTGIALLGTITAAVAAWFVNLVRSAATEESEHLAGDHQAQISDQLHILTEAVERLSAEVASLRAGPMFPDVSK